MQVASQTTLQDSPTADETAVSRQSLLGLNLEEVEEIVTSQGLPRFRARQLWRRVWRHGQTDFGDMTELGKDARDKLSAVCQADRPMITNRQTSKDGTIKW